jgi:hypothetical protein
MNMNPVATSLCHGGRADPAHAGEAVRRALERAGLSRARAVLLFLTPDYAHDPEPALRAAARAAGTLQVMGATGAGILTEEEWVLDSPGAAAMVFGEPFGFDPVLRPSAIDETVLSLATPTGLAADWLDEPYRRLGAVSADLVGHGPFKVWSTARVADTERVETLLAGTRAAVAVTQGVRALTSPIEVAEAKGHELLKLGNYPALSVLVQSLPSEVSRLERMPLYMLMGGVTYGDPENAIREGRYRLNHILSADPREQSITLSERLMPGERLFWAMRDALAAERDMRRTLDDAQRQLATPPAFALLFPCLGRGPQFFGNRDRDLEQLRGRHPGLPVIGMYGNGELGPLDGANHLYQYSTVLGLFAAA